MNYDGVGTGNGLKIIHAIVIVSDEDYGRDCGDDLR